MFIAGSFQEEALMDHRDVVLEAVTLRYSEEAFMEVATIQVLYSFSSSLPVLLLKTTHLVNLNK